MNKNAFIYLELKWPSVLHVTANANGNGHQRNLSIYSGLTMPLELCGDLLIMCIHLLIMYFYITSQFAINVQCI